MMNLYNQKTIKEAISEMIQTYGLRTRLSQTQLRKEWDKIVGKTIARYTERLYVKDNILFLYLTNATLKSELIYNKAILVNKINESLATDFITDVVIR